MNLRNRWVFHPEIPEKIVSDDEAVLLLQQGWYSNPSQFPAKAVEDEVSQEPIAVLEEVGEVAKVAKPKKPKPKAKPKPEIK